MSEMKIDWSKHDGPVIGNATKIIPLPLICEMTIPSTKLTISGSAFCMIPDSITLYHREKLGKRTGAYLVDR